MLALAGMAVVVLGGATGGGAFDALGFGLALLAAAMQAVYVLLGRRGFRAIPSEEATFGVIGVTAAGFLALVLVTGTGDVAALPLRDPAALPALLWAGVAGASVPALLFLLGIRSIGPTRTSIVALVEPVFGALLAALLLAEGLAPVQVGRRGPRAGGRGPAPARRRGRRAPRGGQRGRLSRPARPEPRTPAGPPAAGRSEAAGILAISLRPGSQPARTPHDRGPMRVRKAVFPAAGWGTRFLPATKAQPKEMLPLVDRPVIQYAVEEAVAAGIEQVIIVTSSQKRAIEDHFDLNYELEHLLEERGEIELLRQIRHISDLAQIAYVRQKEQLGLGHAVLMAKELVGHEPFAVILSDDVVVGQRPCIGQLIHAYHQTHGSVVAVMEVPPEETGRYGVIGGTQVDGHGGRLWKVDRVVEKPAPGDGALEPGDHRPLRPDAQDLRQAGADAPGRGRRDPADRRDRGPHGGAAGLRLRLRGNPLRCRDHDGLAQGIGRARPGAARPGPRVRGLPSRPRPLIRPGGRPKTGRERGVAALGDVLGGRYRLVELLGQGGMATIYRATDAQLGREVAVKVLHPEYGRDPDFVARFKQEAQSAASLSHPNIVGVYDFGTDADGPYIVMELVDGEDVATLLRAQRPAPAPPGRAPGRRGRATPSPPRTPGGSSTGT